MSTILSSYLSSTSATAAENHQIGKHRHRRHDFMSARQVNIASGLTAASLPREGRTRPSRRRSGGLDACDGRAPHGFLEQEAEVATAIARFIPAAATSPAPR